MNDDVEMLRAELLDARETVRRLNRRAQRAEARAVKWRRRYVALQHVITFWDRWMRYNHREARVLIEKLWQRGPCWLCRGQQWITRLIG